MKIGIASDHGGFELKSKIIARLKDKGFEIKDFGTNSSESVDYPDYIKLPCIEVAKGNLDRAVVVCGSGIGASIVANKVKGIRCALCYDLFTAEMCRRHNDANVIALGERNIKDNLAFDIIDKWISTDFEGGRHSQRIQKINKLEEEVSL